MILDSNGFFYKVVPTNEETNENERRIMVSEFTYEYDDRNGQNVPETTFAIIPFKRDGKLHVALGWSWCSHKDNPNKRIGRTIAKARALGVIRNPKGDEIKTRNNSTIGVVLKADAQDIKFSITDLCSFSDTTKRILKTIEFLRLQDEENTVTKTG